MNSTPHHRKRSNELFQCSHAPTPLICKQSSDPIHSVCQFIEVYSPYIVYSFNKLADAMNWVATLSAMLFFYKLSSLLIAWVQQAHLSIHFLPQKARGIDVLMGYTIREEQVNRLT